MQNTCGRIKIVYVYMYIHTNEWCIDPPENSVVPPSPPFPLY